MATATLSPNGDDTADNAYYPYVLGIYPATPTTHYDKVQTNDSDSSYVENDMGNSAEADLYYLSASGVPADATINSVTIHSVDKRVHVGAAYAAQAYNLIYTHSAKYEYGHSINDSYADLSDVLTVNPFTGAAWTLAEVNALVAGIRLGWVHGTGRETWGRSTQVYIVVDYTAAGGTAYQKTCSEILGLVDTRGPRTVKSNKSEILGLKDVVGPKHVKVNKTEILGLKDSFNKRGAFHKVVSEILGLVDSVSHLGTIVAPSQAGQWVRRPPLPPQDVLAGLKIWLERKND